MEMKGVDLVMVENGEEEVGERGDKPGEDVVLKERIEGLTRRLRRRGDEPDHRLPSFIVAGCQYREHGGKVFLLADGGNLEGRPRTRGRTGGRGTGFDFPGGHWRWIRGRFSADPEALADKRERGSGARRRGVKEGLGAAAASFVRS